MVKKSSDTTKNREIKEALEFQKDPNAFLLNRSAGSLRLAKKGLELLKNQQTKTKYLKQKLQKEKVKIEKEQQKPTKKAKATKLQNFESEKVKVVTTKLQTKTKAYQKEYQFRFDFGGKDKAISIQSLHLYFNSFSQLILNKLNKIPNKYFSNKSYCYFNSENFLLNKQKNEFSFKVGTMATIAKDKTIIHSLIRELFSKIVTYGSEYSADISYLEINFIIVSERK